MAYPRDGLGKLFREVGGERRGAGVLEQRGRVDSHREPSLELVGHFEQDQRVQTEIEERLLGVRRGPSSCVVRGDERGDELEERRGVWLAGPSRGDGNGRAGCGAGGGGSAAGTLAELCSSALMPCSERTRFTVKSRTLTSFRPSRSKIVKQ